ncbi:putative FAD dependent oxidoreductase [Colletotrichum karsti]|uniref:FAD dependent oxidoreductase n=1 Tax=Colletotrichum karsti TaxID=1095194 RepID=A0A9P6LIZ8_9PEZI|nr:putative FAD dependent oxidoreductase [Colletotrichum karsti]KAF9875173.1 putative FAD dependent oxidoreductase [Colletotrichum karsti]
MAKRLTRNPGLPADQPTASYWQQPLHSQLAGIQSSSLPEERDVVIIGSGITACSVARELLNAGQGMKLTVLEAREICSGATGRNGGRINCMAVLDFEKYCRKFGRQAAIKIVRFELAHFDELMAAATELGPEEFERSEIREVGTCAAVFDDEKLADLQRMLINFEAAFPDLRGRWRIAGAQEVQETFKIPQAKGALIGRAGAAWPYRLITSIWSRLLSEHGENITIEANTPATHIRRVNAPDWHPFYFSQGFDYLTQNARSGELFVGGGDIGGEQALMEPLGEASDAEESITAKAHLAGVVGVVFGKENTGDPPVMRSSWTGIMANTLDGVPLVGMLPSGTVDRRAGDTKAAEWISAGYGGYGMVNAWLCGRAVAQMLMGKGVSEWFPDEYVITRERMRRLRETLEKISGSEMHLKALM